MPRRHLRPQPARRLAAPYEAAFHPLAVLVENVPDVLNFRGRNLAEEIAAELGDMDFVCRYSLLNAVNYGVPQVRERVFLLALRRRD